MIVFFQREFERRGIEEDFATNIRPIGVLWWNNGISCQTYANQGLVFRKMVRLPGVMKRERGTYTSWNGTQRTLVFHQTLTCQRAPNGELMSRRLMSRWLQVVFAMAKYRPSLFKLFLKTVRLPEQLVSGSTTTFTSQKMSDLFSSDALFEAP